MEYKKLKQLLEAYRVSTEQQVSVEKTLLIELMEETMRLRRRESAARCHQKRLRHKAPEPQP